MGSKSAKLGTNLDFPKVPKESNAFAMHFISKTKQGSADDDSVSCQN